MSSLDIDLQYKKGELHGNADGLSRNDCGTCSQCQKIHEAPKTVRLKTRILTLMLEFGGKEWQDNSEEIKNIRFKIGRTRDGSFKLI